MRFYKDFPEAFNELRRELKEMGVKIQTKTVQNKNIENKEGYGTLELQNYTYTVLDTDISKIPLKSPEWAEAEFTERISGIKYNPGQAYHHRAETWTPFLQSCGKFDYTYPERMADTLDNIVETLKGDLYSRRAFLPIWDPILDVPQNTKRRVPCTLGYWFNYRNDKLNITYLLRSSDFSEHYNYDVYLATRLRNHIADRLAVEYGTFTHWIGSFHIFEHDVEGVF